VHPRLAHPRNGICAAVLGLCHARLCTCDGGMTISRLVAEVIETIVLCIRRAVDGLTRK
jgi:hypothetical protein